MRYFLDVLNSRQVYFLAIMSKYSSDERVREPASAYAALNVMSQATFGRYRIIGELGRGATGMVYRAHDPLIERDVAIKTLSSSLPDDVIGEMGPRFLREAKSAGRLNHPNIVTIYDVGEQDGVAYIAMELLEGRSLRLILKESARLPFQTTAEYVAQIADALHCAQELGIVHRDVKPANVVISAKGHVKLTDFGVAFMPSSTMTQTGTMIGSPQYMSPEQVLGLPIDPRSDIFSLGVVLYEMLSGQTPFIRPGDSTIFPLVNRIAAEPHSPVRLADPSIPAEFEAVLSKALAKTPEHRYQRGDEMANDLRNLCDLRSPGMAPTPIGDEKTVLLAPSSRTVQRWHERTVVYPTTVRTAWPPSPLAETNGRGFLLDTDILSRKFDAGKQAQLTAEEEARRKTDEEARLWREGVARRRETFERENEDRRNALDLLKENTSPRSHRDDANFDKSMRAALEYLSDLARKLNGVNPLCERPYDYIFLGRLPEVRLSNALVDMLSDKISGEERGYFLYFEFRAQPTSPANANLLGADITRFSEFLRMKNIPIEAKAKEMSEAGQVTRAEFTISAPLPCEVNIRADYDKSSVEIELVNVRRPGRFRRQIEPNSLARAVEDLARYILGVDDNFER